MKLYYIYPENIVMESNKKNLAVDFISELENNNLTRGSIIYNNKEILFFDEENIDKIQDFAISFLDKKLKYKTCDLKITERG